jgi:hypothetical protein
MNSKSIYNVSQSNKFAKLIKDIDYSSWSTLQEGGRYKKYMNDSTTPKWICNIKNRVVKEMKIKNYIPEPTAYQCLLRFDSGIEFSPHVDTIYPGYFHKRYNIYFTKPDKDCYILHENNKTKIIPGICYEVKADKLHGLSKIIGNTSLLGILFGYLIKES